MDNTLKAAAGVFLGILIACIVIFFILPQPSAAPPYSEPDITVPGDITVYFFYGEECPHCHNVMPFIRNLSEKYPEVEFHILETWHNETNNALSQQLHKKLGIRNAGVPEVIVMGNNTPLVGDRDIPANLENVILDQLKKKQ
jgi:thiol-disulfide isomerase/thioredoxin